MAKDLATAVGAADDFSPEPGQYIHPLALGSPALRVHHNFPAELLQEDVFHVPGQDGPDNADVVMYTGNGGIVAVLGIQNENGICAVKNPFVLRSQHIAQVSLAFQGMGHGDENEDHHRQGEPVRIGAGLRLTPDDLRKLMFKRQALHSASFSLRHPADGKEMQFSSPLPGELDSFVKKHILQGNISNG